MKYEPNYFYDIRCKIVLLTVYDFESIMKTYFNDHRFSQKIYIDKIELHNNFGKAYTYTF